MTFFLNNSIEGVAEKFKNLQRKETTFGENNKDGTFKTRITIIKTRKQLQNSLPRTEKQLKIK